MGQAALGIAFIVGGSVAESPAIVLLGLALVFVEAIRQVWARRGLDGIEYSRHLAQPRGVVGDELPLDISVWNRKRLPLAWLKAEDVAGEGVRVRERALVEGSSGESILRNAWTLAPFERVVRHFHLVAERRGVYQLGPARLEVGDLLARSAAVDEAGTVDRWIVWPRSVSVRTADREQRWGGELRARRGLLEDPTRYAGVRPYQPGDPLRRVHWKATSRLGVPVTKRLDPSREREVVIALDIQTVSDAAWSTAYDDDLVEGLCVAAASIARQLRDEGASVGLAAAAYSGAVRPFAYLAPGQSRGQLGRILDLLARLSSFPSAPFERLLTSLLRSLRPGTSILVLSARSPATYLPALRRVAAAGYPVHHIAFGPDAAELAARVRAGGIESRPARLDGPWRTSERLVIA
jgi:uncharacterized protein (DUF58 family)